MFFMCGYVDVIALLELNDRTIVERNARLPCHHDDPLGPVLSIPAGIRRAMPFGDDAFDFHRGALRKYFEHLVTEVTRYMIVNISSFHAVVRASYSENRFEVDLPALF